MVRVTDQLRNRDQEDEEGQKIARDQNGDHRGMTIDCHSDSAGGADATCVRLDPVVQRRGNEDVSWTSSTQYSDVEDSVDGDEERSWSNDQRLQVSREQNSDDHGAPVFVSDVPTVDDVCIKNSPNVHFGEKTFYNGPVSFEKIVYPHPNSTEANHGGDDNRSHGIPKDRNSHLDSGAQDRTDSENALDHDEATKWYNWMLTWRCVAMICVMGACLVTAVVVGVLFLSNGDLIFVERAEWGAKPPTGPLDKIELPVPFVIISHTATGFCQAQTDCSLIVRQVQSFHAESRKWSDIGYNFLVGGDGYAYVGRGWDFVGAHSYGYNNRSIGISFVGTFNDVAPKKRQLLAAQQLIELGIKEGKIASNYKLLGHRQVSRTLSPGQILYNILKTWPHWSPTP